MQYSEYSTRHGNRRASKLFARPNWMSCWGLAEGGIRKLLEVRQRYVDL